MSVRLYLITTAYPFGVGESFLEEEMRCFAADPYFDVTVVPLLASGVARKLPANILVDDSVARELERKRQYRWLYGIGALIRIRPTEEFSWHVGKMKMLFSALTSYGLYRLVFARWLRKKPTEEKTVVYTYWHTEATYALGMLLRTHGNYRVVSRIHGYDLYESRRPYGCMPLKRRFIGMLQRLYTISESAARYVADVYGFDARIVRVARLGVRDRKIAARISPPKSLHIVSCSFLVAVKRVEIVVQSLALLARRFPELSVVWHHIGDGPLRGDLETYAREQLGELPNVKYRFEGQLDNDAVYAFYRDHPVDVLVNVSASEGVPVTMMEAMSCHIPVLATDVGAVSEIVKDGRNGRLLSAVSPADEVASKLAEISFWKAESTRNAAYRTFAKDYDAQKNYSEFLESLKGIA